VTGVKREAAIAFLVDKRGEILDVLRDDLGLSERLRRGRPLTALVDVDSLMDAVRFLRALAEQSAALGHELLVPWEEEKVALKFGGVATEKGLLVVGATSAVLLDHVRGELGRVVDEGLHVIDAEVNDDAAGVGVAEVSTLAGAGDGSGTEAADETVDDLVALCRRVATRHEEVRRLRHESARCLHAAATDLRLLAAAVRARPAPWPDALRADVGDALLACAQLLAELAHDDDPGA